MLEVMYYGKINSPATYLTTSIDEVQTEIAVADTSKLPAAPNLVTLGAGGAAETIRYNGILGNTLLNVERGFQGTAKVWALGTKVARNFTAYDYDVIINNILALEQNITTPAPIYGVTWDKGSVSTLTRTDDAIGFVANVGVDGQLVDNDFDSADIFGDISEVTDVQGNVFMRIPKFYIQKIEGANLRLWRVSKQRYSGFYLPWCFWNFENNRELPYIDIGKHKATLSADSKLESKPDKYPLINTNIVQMRTYARNNNANGLEGYQQLDVHTYDVLQTLMRIEFANLNTQSVMAGYTTGRYGVESELAVITEIGTNRIVVSNATAANYRAGQTVSVGTARYGTQVFYGRTITAISDYDVDNKAIHFDGAPVDIAVGNFLQNTGWKNGFSRSIAASSGSLVSNSDGKYPCSYRGIESPYGDVWQFVDGININEFQAWVTENPEDYASNVFANPYKQLSYLNAGVNGYVMSMGYDITFPFAELPTAVGGNSSAYYADYYYQATGQRIALVGGYWTDGVGAGPSCWPLNTSSSGASVVFGGRLLKKPLV